MNQKAKSNSVVTSKVAEDGNIVFTVLGVGELVLEVGKAHGEILKRAATHGLIQRVSDRAAKPRDTGTGQPQSPVEKFAAMKELVDYYNGGAADWSMPRVGGTGGGRDSLFFRVMAELRPEFPAESLKEWCKTRSVAEKAAILASGPAAKIVKRIEAEQVKAAGIDVSALLAELKGA